MGQGAHEFDPMCREKTGQVRIPGIRNNDREITPVEDVAPGMMAGGDKPPEMGIQFRSSPCDIDRRDIISDEYVKAFFQYGSGHDLCAVGPCIHMAMCTGLIAELSHIDL